MAESTVYTIVLGPLSGGYKIQQDGDPLYETRLLSGELKFRPPGEDEPVLVLKAPSTFDFFTGMKYRLTDLETDEVVGDLGDDVAMFGRRWEITTPEGERTALIRPKGKMATLLREIGPLRYVIGPAPMEILGPGERPVGTIEHTVGVHHRVTVTVETDAGFDPRLAMAAAVLFDAADRRNDRIRRDVDRNTNP